MLLDLLDALFWLLLACACLGFGMACWHIYEFLIDDPMDVFKEDDDGRR